MTFLKEYHRNHLNELWLIFAFTAALAFLIASSYMSAQFLQYGMPWSDLAAKNFSLSSLKKIPISDVAENLSSAIFIHNNLILRQQHPRLVDDLPTNIMDYYLRLWCEPFDSQSKLCVINNLAR